MKRGSQSSSPRQSFKTNVIEFMQAIFRKKTFADTYEDWCKLSMTMVIGSATVLIYHH